MRPQGGLRRMNTWLAACERHQLDGNTALLGIAVGAPTLCRLSLIAQRLIHKEPVSPTAVLGTLAAATGVKPP
jgi:hypothetical protein